MRTRLAARGPDRRPERRAPARERATTAWKGSEREPPRENSAVPAEPGQRTRMEHPAAQRDGAGRGVADQVEGLGLLDDVRYFSLVVARRR